jgi:hypothetical protein
MLSLRRGLAAAAVAAVALIAPTSVAFATTPSDTQTTPSDTQTTPSGTETTPSDTETTPSDTETTPSDTETTPSECRPVTVELIVDSGEVGPDGLILVKAGPDGTGSVALAVSVAFDDDSGDVPEGTFFVDLDSGTPIGDDGFAAEDGQLGVAVEGLAVGKHFFTVDFQPSDETVCPGSAGIGVVVTDAPPLTGIDTPHPARVAVTG